MFSAGDIYDLNMEPLPRLTLTPPAATPRLDTQLHFNNPVLDAQINAAIRDRYGATAAEVASLPADMKLKLKEPSAPFTESKESAGSELASDASTAQTIGAVAQAAGTLVTAVYGWLTSKIGVEMEEARLLAADEQRANAVEMRHKAISANADTRHKVSQMRTSFYSAEHARVQAEGELAKAKAQAAENKRTELQTKAGSQHKLDRLLYSFGEPIRS